MVTRFNEKSSNLLWDIVRVQEVGNALLTPPKTQVSMHSCDHLCSLVYLFDTRQCYKAVKKHRESPDDDSNGGRIVCATIS
ncbi:hypothetical protein EVAR_93626_1 [Eumeta japonica]|uniref:Uncharacterized protein n=1 Tax=Eumeta variegata TaxID=151549 RepID=A0A4C1TQL0_EUMVA|nr:hypothetical protein EVAR_93626_1 [Eumeta japonica]